MTKYILPHLGLGDYLVCNGLIRNLVNKKPIEKFILFVNQNYKDSIHFMLKDIENLEFSYLPAVEFNRTYILPYIKHHPYFLIIIGYDTLDRSKTADRSFYEALGYDFNKRWDDFYIEREWEREMALFDKFDVKEGKYIFLHESPGIGVNDNIIDRNKLSDLPIVQADIKYTKNIFDYCYLLEHAAEIHCIESSFLFLIDSIETNGKLYSHRYARHLYDYTVPNLKKKWTILK